jgi:hypothetical protein
MENYIDIVFELDEVTVEGLRKQGLGKKYP